MRARAAVVALVVVGAALPGLANPSSALEPPSITDVGEACDDSPVAAIPEGGSRTCFSLHRLGHALGHACRHTPAGDDATCSTLDGRTLDPALVDAYEETWTHEALSLQRALDRDVPFVEAFIPHTHNSYNSVAYFPGVSGLDDNQVLSMTDQLRLDMRGIEIDIHWVASAEGEPRAPVMCHAATVDPAGTAAPGVHAGCSIERHLRHGLAELRAWLDANPGEFVVLYLENHLEADPAAHAAAAAAISSELGGTVHRPPPEEACAPMPYDASVADLAADGDQVLIVGDCDPAVAGAYGTWVHERGPRWDEAGNGRGDDYAPSGCAAEREARGYGENFIRTWEDGTWLSAMAGGGGEVTPAEVARMATCGLNFIGFDHLHPQDPSLEALVWSWAPGAPNADEGCAFAGEGGRFHDGDCAKPRVHACHGPAGWTITSHPGAWSAGRAACHAMGAAFAVPWNGWELDRLREAAHGAPVWLDYRAVEGAWTPEASDTLVLGGARSP